VTSGSSRCGSPASTPTSGGYPEGELADITLLWMVDRVESCGLAFRPDAFPEHAPKDAHEEVIPVHPDPRGELHESRTGLYLLLPALHRPIGAKDPAHERVASTARERYDDDPGYRPEQLTAYLDAKHGVGPIPVPRSAAEAGEDVGRPA